MDDSTTRRLARLEDRVAALEQRLGATAAPAPTAPAAPDARIEPADVRPALAGPDPTGFEPAQPGSVQPDRHHPDGPGPGAIGAAAPAASPARNAPHSDRPAARAAGRRPSGAPQPRRSAAELERFLGLAVLGRVGVFAVLLAGAWFAQLGWARMNPGPRVLGLHAAAAAMLGAGLWLQPRVRRGFTALLLGGGVALGYVAAIAAGLVYELVPPEVAFALLAAWVAIGQWLARRIGLQTMAVVALAGGYLAPWLVGAAPAAPTLLFAWLLLLHGWAAYAEQRWGWLASRRLAVVATGATALLWLGAHPHLSTWSIALHAEAVLIGLIAPELHARFRGTVSDGRWSLATASAWIAQALLVLLVLNHDAARALPLLAGAGWLGLAAALTAARPDQRETGARDIARLGGVLLVLGAWLVWRVPIDSAAPPRLLDLPIERLNLLQHAVPRVLASAAAALLVLGTRRRSGADDVPALLAAVLGLAAVMAHEVSLAGRALAALALVVPAALALRGANALGRVGGAAIGGAIAFWIVRLQDTFATPALSWLPVASASSLAWLAVLGLVAQSRRDDALAQPVDALLRSARGGIAFLLLAAAPLLLGQFDRLPEWPAQAWTLTGVATLGFAAMLTHGGGALARRGAAVAELGGGLLVIGVLALCVAGPSALPLLGHAGAQDQLVQSLWLAAAVPLLFALRRRTGGADVAAALAATLAVSVVLAAPDAAAVRPWTAVAALAPAGLVLGAHVAWARSLGLCSGVLLLFGGVGAWTSFAADDAGWLSVAFGTAGGFAALGALLASWRRDRVLLMTALALLAALGLGWSAMALAAATGAAADPALAFWNARFAAAVALVALLEFARRRLPAGSGALERVAFAAIVLAVPYLAGLVELLQLVADWPAGWSSATVSLYSLLFALGLLAAGFARRDARLRWPGLGGFAFVVGKVLVHDLGALDLELRMLVTGAVGLVLLGGAWAYARRRGDGPR
ncbi:MAG: DUF2339 domain-containing protein [Planctomycetota bacterium]